MAYDVSYDWAHHRRWRRRVARVFALLALVAVSVGLYQIVREATRDEPPAPITLTSETARVEASTSELAQRLGALRSGRSREDALAALREAKSDRDALSAALARHEASEVRDATLLAIALDAHRRYLSAVGSLLRDPRGSELLGALPRRARRARRAWAAVPYSGGLPQAISGWKRLAVLARAARG